MVRLNPWISDCAEHGMFFLGDAMPAHHISYLDYTFCRLLRSGLSLEESICWDFKMPLPGAVRDKGTASHILIKGMPKALKVNYLVARLIIFQESLFIALFNTISKRPDDRTPSRWSPG
jgi:hypothetical protein